MRSIGANYDATCHFIRAKRSQNHKFQSSFIMTSNNLDGLKNLPKNLEGLKKLGEKYQEESVEDRKRRRCQLAFPAVLNLAAGIAMVAIGAVFHEECVGNKATLFLMVGGGILIGASTLKLVVFLPMLPADYSHKTAEPLSGLLDFAYFIVAIWGSVVVFGKKKSSMGFNSRNLPHSFF